jgi:Domain of unknown function (DUF4407)
MREILWRIAGADPDILNTEDCKGDRKIYTALGVIVLVTASFAALSSTYAFWTVFKDLPIAISLGLFWGFSVANIDRFLIMTTVKHNSFSIEQLVTSSIRILMACIIGIIISKPLELAIFQKEISAEIDTRNLSAEVRMKETISGLPESVEIARLRQESQQLRDQDAKLNANYQQIYASTIGEAEGTSGTGKAGKGIVYTDKLSELERQKAILVRTTSQHESQIAENNEKVTQLEKTLTVKTDRVRGSRLEANSLLAQITTLEEMGDKNPAVAWTSRLLSLAFISIDVLPVVCKLLMDRTDYDSVKRRIRKEVVMRQDALVQNLDWQIAEETRRDNALEAEYSGFLEQTLAESLKQAYGDPEMIKVIYQTAQKFISRVGERLSQAIDSISIPDSRIKQEAKEAVESQMQDIAKPAAKRKVVRRRIQHQVADYTRDLRDYLEKFKNKY